MHRKPDPKAAATLLVQAFAAQGVTLKHQAALNLLATLEGHESYAHLKAASREASATPDTEEHVVHLLFSEEYVQGLNRARDNQDEEGIQEMLKEARTFRFASARELQIFLDGVEAGCGWLEYENVTDAVKASDTAH